MKLSWVVKCKALPVQSYDNAVFHRKELVGGNREVQYPKTLNLGDNIFYTNPCRKDNAWKTKKSLFK